MLLLICLLLLICAIFIKPMRKAVGLLFVILGVIECLSIIGIIIGIPTILIGGMFLFI